MICHLFLFIHYLRIILLVIVKININLVSLKFNLILSLETTNRFKRSEGIIFRTLYEVHKILTLVFTGKLIKFGNFSCIPKSHVKELVTKSYLWNSYSSSIIKTTGIPTSIGIATTKTLIA